MAGRKQDPEQGAKTSGVNPGYAVFQLSKALTASEDHEEPDVRKRGKERVSKWKAVLENILEGAADYGSRTPIAATPAWATLEVVTGGFATGELLAGGPLRDHEKALLERFPESRKRQGRLSLNSYFLTDEGLGELFDRLKSGRYDVDLPEEGALMVAAWLADNGHSEKARELVDEISPFFSKLRFYPIPLDRPRTFGARVHVQDVGETVENLRKIGPNMRILTQKEAVEVWAPFYDRLVALFLETVEDGWPCRTYPDGWKRRAFSLLDEYADLRKAHRLCAKPERTDGNFALLREFLALCRKDASKLTGREVGRIRLILDGYVKKRGFPGSRQCTEARSRQRMDVRHPTHHEIAKVVIPRLEKLPGRNGIDDIEPLRQPVVKEEAECFGLPEGTPIPESIGRKVERCLNETAEVLVERGLITSGDTLARVLPQTTSGIRAAGIRDPRLRGLYAAIYRAFRRRRSLLLLNLEKQVQIEELPWIAAIDGFRGENLSSRELAGQTLEETALLVLSSFPHAVVPNKLLQEMRALAGDASLDMPLVEELAADIFMGEFSPKFLESAKRAADFLDGTLYAVYYGIDREEIRRIPEKKEKVKRVWFRRSKMEEHNRFARLCALRAGVSLDTWDPAINGMIIEQQQILTTQNLAALFCALDLAEALRDRLSEMARHCFRWVCRRQQTKTAGWRSRLKMLKNTAYAWRQMIFFLSLVDRDEIAEFIGWAQKHLEKQSEDFRVRFHPALKGLMLAAQGRSLDSESAASKGARRFLGWSKTGHWL